MAARRLTLAVAQHARDLEHAILPVNHPDVARGHPAPCLLRDDEVLIGPGGDLREMGDDQHLMPLGDFGQGSADLRADFATDPLVDLVEDERLHRVVSRARP